MPDKRVLMVVDDDADDRHFFCNAIKELDPSYVCMQACNGADALEQLRNTQNLPDYIFLDLNMPMVNGRECLIELKKDERLKNIPVIIYTTTSYKRNIDEMMQLGASAFL